MEIVTGQTPDQPYFIAGLPAINAIAYEAKGHSRNDRADMTDISRSCLTLDGTQGPDHCRSMAPRGLSGVEPALRTNSRQVRNSVPLRVEAKSPGLTRCHGPVVLIWVAVGLHLYSLSSSEDVTTGFLSRQSQQTSGSLKQPSIQAQNKLDISITQVIHRGGLDELCGARWRSISDDGFIDGIKSHIGLSGGATLAAEPGWRERELGNGSKGQRGGRSPPSPFSSHSRTRTLARSGAERQTEVLVSLEAGCWRLDPGPRTALAAQSLVGHGALVHGGVVAIAQLRRGVAPNPAKSGHQRA
ncbi:hypothetical protein EYF80_008518 [Liparis tanakae]|uniref:Uncharacterized protein n=1 Tax=Liparis tanakae TaxID=230148 RepID=A0A4Z2IUI3_9TELE|nr:hypothetical protein EYF80_008518 [Liparis tanakae]